MKFDGPLLHDRWRLGPRLGAGNQAQTYLARDESSDPKPVVVVKQLRLATGSSTWKKFDLFEREVRVLKSLRHRGIPRFLDSFESEPGVFNLVMEKAPGISLGSARGMTLWSDSGADESKRAIATKARFTDDDLRDLMARILEILDYLHTRNPPVIHRDIKPANLLRAADGQVSLVDFGGVRDVLRQEGGSTVVGTFGYMAPEQLHGQATPATDLYALGATLVALAGGVEPENVPRRGLRMDLNSHLKSSDPVLVDLLCKLTEPDPDDRPQSAAAVLEELKRRPGRRPVALARPDRPAPPARHGRRRGPPIGRRRRDLARADDDIAGFLDELPRPLRLPVRALVFLIGTFGFLGLTVFRFVGLPIIFGIVSALSRDDRKPRIAEVRGKVEYAVDEGRTGFRALSAGRRPPPALPPAKGE